MDRTGNAHNYIRRVNITTTHTILGGKVRLYRRNGGRYWQCAGRFKGENIRISTKEDGLAQAKDFAEDWYRGLRGKQVNGDLVLPSARREKTFADAAERFTEEYEILTEGTRSPLWGKGHKDRLRLHLLPFFGELGVSEVTPGKLMEYRVHRRQTTTTGKPPAANTIHNELITLR